MDDDAGYAVAAWREEGRWSVAALPPRATESLDAFLAALRQLIAEGGALGFLVVDEDFFLGVRMMPDGAARLTLTSTHAGFSPSGGVAGAWLAPRSKRRTVSRSPWASRTATPPPASESSPGRSSASRSSTPTASSARAVAPRPGARPRPPAS